MSRPHAAAARPFVSATPPADRAPPDYVRGFYVLCATVGLERFSFFLLSAVLVLYLNERLGIPATHAVELYGYFVCGSYVTPLLGGQLGDGRLGCHRTTLIGGVLQAIGYGLLFCEHRVSLYAALVLMALGSGLFKAGTQALLGSLYPPCDGRRDRSFSVFYMVINVSALCAPLLGGWTQERAGWPGCFAVASMTALGSVTVFALGQRWVSVRVPVTPEVLPAPLPQRRARWQLAVVLLAGLVFAVNFVQSHSSLLLWARDRTARRVGSWTIPVAWFAAAPAALVLLLTPLLSALFAALRRRHREPATLHKIALGLAVSALAYLPLWLAAALLRGAQKLSPLWVLGGMTLLACGELLVPALAPAEITRTAQPAQRGRQLSYWFVAVAAGNILGGWIHF